MSKRKNQLLERFEKKDEIKSCKFLKGNTLEIILNDGTRYVRFHETNIIVETDKTITLNTDGYFTSTTKQRINEFCPFQIDIWQKNNMWFFAYNEEQVMFYDFITFDKNGTILTEIKKDKSREIRRLKKRISEFANLLDKMDHLELPSGSDCWYCALRTKEGKTMGDVSKDTDHLIQHMKKKYLHPSLIYNALKECHGNDSFISIVFQSPEMFSNWRSDVKRHLRRYLQNKLISALINE